jgi:hypothetical protein
VVVSLLLLLLLGVIGWLVGCCIGWLFGGVGGVLWLVYGSVLLVLRLSFLGFRGLKELSF